MTALTFHALEELRRSHPAWRLLASPHAAFVGSFLHATFIVPNVRTLPAHALSSRLDDHLHALREELGPGALPRTSTEYLDEWASDRHGWLRKYYPEEGDEPCFDLTAGTEKALEWLASMRQRQFVGTESRLLTVFDLLRQLAEQTDPDVEARLAELKRRRDVIDGEMDRLLGGEVRLLDSTRIKDRFQQIVATARGLLSDFREVEQNFRELDRGVREKIATWHGTKAELLERIFGDSDAILDSDQGRSFRAFWDFLMAPARQEELTNLLQRAFALPAVRELAPDRRLQRIHFDWLEAGEIAQRTVGRLSEQLRRYVDDQAWAEERRVMRLIRSIEEKAISVRAAPPAEAFAFIDETAPEIALPLERPLYSPPIKPEIRAGALEEGEAQVSAEALLQQFYVDRAVLEANIRRSLQSREQVTLPELLSDFPLQKGLAELVTYLKIASDEPGQAVIDPDTEQAVSWCDETGVTRSARLPRLIFLRAPSLS